MSSGSAVNGVNPAGRNQRTRTASAQIRSMSSQERGMQEPAMASTWLM